jgi:hypothetical protein
MLVAERRRFLLITTTIASERAERKRNRERDCPRGGRLAPTEQGQCQRMRAASVGKRLQDRPGCARSSAFGTLGPLPEVTPQAPVLPSMCRPRWRETPSVRLRL